MSSITMPPREKKKDKAVTNKRFYLAAWRWHFYAGLFVVPFIVMLSLTGLIMVLHEPMESWQYGDRLFVEPGDASSLFSAEAQVAVVREAYPDATINQYIPATAVDRSTQISILPSGNAEGVPAWEQTTLTVFVNPYTGDILGTLDPSTTWYSWANDVHGSFFIAQTGDYLIEIAASLSILLVVTGVFMWWPRNGKSWRETLFPSLNKPTRLRWRDLHASIGFWISVGILFFMVSGLAWTSIWGGEFVQPWSSFPAEKWGGPVSDETHASLNRGVLEEVPWALEQTPLPLSGSMAGQAGIPAEYAVTLDTVMAFARDNGFSNFRVNLPSSPTDVWTVSADTMSGDITDPRDDRTLHIDQYTGNALADVGFAEYSLMGKAMAAGIALHQGDAGLLNTVANVLFCLAMIFISVSGVVMWWMRRPKTAGLRVIPPPMPKQVNVWRGAVVLMLVLSLFLPLAAVLIVSLIVLDFLIFSRIPALKRVYG